MKKVVNVLIFLITIFVVILLFLFVRIRGSVKVSPNEDILITENIVFFRQDDTAWAEDKLGTSKYTIGSSGCLVSCIASGLSMCGPVITPGEFNQIHGDEIYDGEGNLLWGKLEECSDYSVTVYSQLSEEILMDCLIEEIFPIVRVRMNGIGNFHYVLIVKAEEGMFYCMDPLKDGLIPLSKYGNRIYAIRAVYNTNN